MPLVDTYRRRLHDRALDQYGFVTTRDAGDLGIPTGELAKLARRGGLQNVAYGVWRFDDIPHTGHDQYMEAVLRVGPGAYLTHDAVLALHELALVNPRRIRVGTAKRARPKIPRYIEIIQRHLPNNHLTGYDGIPATTVAQALLDSRNFVMADRLIAAAREAAKNGLMTKRETERVLAELEKSA